jgi:hypothetical protein
LETFTVPREFVESDRYTQDRLDSLSALDLASIDKPIQDIVSGFATLLHCFPIQSCVGHFICAQSQDIHALDPIPTWYTGPVRYRIAYIAVCIENSPRGHTLRQSLAEIPAIDPTCIQFGSADWFWDQWANSYALQVEPMRYMSKDEAILDVTEALHIQGTRDLFFEELRKLLSVGSIGFRAW